jgi:hypothetical protein
MAAETVNLWHLSSSQLSTQIAQIANGDPATYDDATRTEAGLLMAEWHDALSLPKASMEDQSRRAIQLDALQKRSIEILVRLSQAS